LLAPSPDESSNGSDYPAVDSGAAINAGDTARNCTRSVLIAWVLTTWSIALETLAVREQRNERQAAHWLKEVGKREPCSLIHHSSSDSLKE